MIHIDEDVTTFLGTSSDDAGDAGQSGWQAKFTARYSRDKWSAILQPRFIGEGVWSNDASANHYSVPGFDELPTPAAIAMGYDHIFDNIGRYYRVSCNMSL